MRWSRNLPNFLTAARIALTPAIALLIVEHDYREALLLVAIAGVTDGADGFLARRFDWKSRFGAYLDPVADKLLLVTVYLALGVVGGLPWWLVGIVFGRDLAILAFAAWAFAFTALRSFPPSIWGKLSTALQIAAALLALGALARWIPPILATAAVWFAAAGTLWSACDYARRGWTMLRSVSV